MKNPRNNIAANLRHLRNAKGMSQEAVAERIGVTRQAVAKWESGETLPDILNCEALAVLFDVSLNELVRHDPDAQGKPIGLEHKHLFGTAVIGERGQIVLPKRATYLLDFHPGLTLVVLGDTNPLTPGLALIDSQAFLRMTGTAADGLFPGEGG